jgi:hypothetical protein
MIDHQKRNLNDGKRPDFLCIGAQRSGTTWLYKNLSSHPQLWLPPIKELHYFSGRDKPLKRKINVYLRHLRVRILDNFRDLISLSGELPGKLAWDLHYFFGTRSNVWYSTLFRFADGKITGEITPDYAAMDIEQLHEIKQLNPEIKIIYILREPMERSWSGATKDLARQRRRHLETVPDEELLKKLNGPGTMLRSNYLQALEKWEAVFEEKQIFIGFFEDVVTRPEELLQRIYRFLDVSDSSQHISPNINIKVNSAGEYKSPIPQRFQLHLAKQQIDQLRELSKRFGGPTNDWLKRAEENLANPYTKPAQKIAKTSK